MNKLTDYEKQNIINKYPKSYKCHKCGKPTGFYEGESGKKNCPHCGTLISSGISFNNGICIIDNR